MRVLIATESRFDRTPDGTCWNVGSGGYEFWQRYLDVFDEVRILGRMRDVPVAPRSAVRADGPNVSLVPLPVLSLGLGRTCESIRPCAGPRGERPTPRIR